MTVPNACELLDHAALVSLLGDPPGSPRPAGNEKSERRSCTWLAPSAEHLKATLIVHAAGEGLKGITDKKERAARTQQRYARETLHGGGSCEYVQGSRYPVCWFLERQTLWLAVLKEDLIITAAYTHPGNRNIKKDRAIASVRRITGDLTANI